MHRHLRRGRAPGPALVTAASFSSRQRVPWRRASGNRPNRPYAVQRMLCHWNISPNRASAACPRGTDLGPLSGLQKRIHRVVSAVGVAVQQRARQVAVFDGLDGVLPAEPEEPEQAGHFSTQRRVLNVVDPGLDHGDLVGQAVLPDMANDRLESVDDRLLPWSAMVWASDTHSLGSGSYPAAGSLLT